MADLKINITADASKAVAEAKASAQALQGTAEAVRGAADETERYNAALRQMAMAEKAAAQAQRAAADESERYQQTLEQMAGREAGATGSRAQNPFDEWLSAVQERKAALKQEGEVGVEAARNIATETGKAVAKKGELKQVIQQLTREFPALGAVARLVVHPIVAAATMAATAFTFLRDQIAKFEAGLSDTQWGSYAKKAGAAADQVQAVADAAKEAEDATARLLDVFNAQQSAEERLANARKRLEVEKANTEQDPVKRAAKLLEIETRYGREEIAREDRGRQFKLQQQEERAKKLRAEATALTQEEARLTGISQRVGTPEEARAELEEWKKRYEETKAERIKQQETFDQMYGGGWKRAKYELIPGYSDQMWSARDQAEQLGAQEAYFAKIIADREAALGISERTDARLGSVRENRRGALASAAGIEAMLPTQRRVAEIEGSAAREAFGIDTMARLAGAAASGAKEQGRLAEEAAKQFEQNGAVARQTAEALARQADFNEALAATLKRLESQVNNMRSH